MLPDGPVINAGIATGPARAAGPTAGPARTAPYPPELHQTHTPHVIHMYIQESRVILIKKKNNISNGQYIIYVMHLHLFLPRF